MIASSLSSSPPEDEALFVRRIMEFWRDGDDGIVEQQINEFLQQYPNSNYQQRLYLLLGDAAFRSEQYRKALECYDKIDDDEVRKKSYNHRLKALYQLHDYSSLQEEAFQGLPPKIEDASENSTSSLALFFYAESLYRQAQNHNKTPQQTATLYKRAIPYYQQLQGTSYYNAAQFALAEIFCFLEDYPQAAKLFNSLAKNHPESRETLLYNAANVEASFNTDKAIETFKEIQKIHGEKAPDAAFKELVLLYESERYQELVKARQRFTRLIAKDRQPYLFFLLGQSYYQLKDYEMALGYLDAFEDTQTTQSPERKASFLTTIAAAYHLNQQALVDSTSRKLEDLFPEDPEIANALYFQAMMYKKVSKNLQALQKFERIAVDFPNFPRIESAKFERNTLLFQENMWRDCRRNFLTFLDNYPDSPFHPQALRYILKSSAKLQQEAPSDPTRREQLVDDIRTTLKYQEELSEEEVINYTLLMCQMLYELQYYEKTITIIEEFLTKYPHSNRLAYAHYLLAGCYYEAFQDLAAFTAHGEKTLTLDPGFPEQSSLHLNLFNAYLKQAQELADKDPSKEALLDRAAEHLYIADNKKLSLKFDNLLWLAHHYHQKASKLPKDPHNPELIESASRAYNTLLSILMLDDEDYHPKHFFTGKHFLEEAYLMLSDILSWQEHYADQIELLENLQEYQSQHPEMPWHRRSRLNFALAQAYQHQGYDDKAIAIYRDLQKSISYKDHYINNASKLYLARLLWKNLDRNNCQANNPSFIEILTLLKEVKIQKKLSSEPLHLEAAIDYCDIRNASEPSDVADQHLLSILQNTRQDFVSQDDIASKDYQARRELLPQQNRIYQAYLMLIDARIALLQSKLAARSGELLEARQRRQAAATILKTLTEGHYAVSDYLVNHAEQYLQQLSSSSETES
ncbi:MAG: tetratricopeptide repeat protein [Chlamydiota bacterium]